MLTGGSALKRPSIAQRVLSGLLHLGVLSTSGEALARDALEERILALETRVERLNDRASIEKLTRAYGYYVDKQIWPEVVACFSEDAVVEIAGRGVYHGREGADRLFRLAMGGGRVGLAPGALFNHMILQGVVDVAPDGASAKGRWRAFVQIGQHQAFGIWSEGTYENEYVKRDGVWQISRLHFFATFYAPYDSGWAKVALPNNSPSKTAPPDAPQSIEYDVYPGHFVPPFHYPNPVSGRVWTMDDSRRWSTRGQSPPPAAAPIQPGSPPPVVTPPARDSTTSLPSPVGTKP